MSPVDGQLENSRHVGRTETPGRTVKTAIAYLRVSTDQQGDSGAGLEAQTAAIARSLAAQNLQLVATYTDVASGGSMKRRPELTEALYAMAEGRAGVLVVAKLDRLSRSLLDFAELMARAQREGWAIVALDIGVDTSTINGELVANIIMALAQWERRIIGQRTKDSLAALRDRGVLLGRPSETTPETRMMIRILRGEGWSYRAIAKKLTAEGMRTGHGAERWYASTVRAVEQRSAVIS